MVQQANAEEFRRAAKTLSQAAICFARGGVATGVIMDDHDAVGAEDERRLEDLARVANRLIAASKPQTDRGAPASHDDTAVSAHW